MSALETETAGDRPRRFLRIRAGQLLGLLFLIGPLSDLADASLPPARLASISVLVAAFVALFLVLLPPLDRTPAEGRPRLLLGSHSSR